jgi:hypothetical protein
MTWNTPTAWLSWPSVAFRSRLALHLSTAPGYGEAGVITPEQIALGRSDGFLVAMGRNLARSRRIVYLRIMGEPNGHWNAYSAFNADGSYRGEQNSPQFYIEAWRRTVLILRGGPVRRLNRRLRALGLPRLRARTPHSGPLARPKVAFLWVPQDAGSPEIAANAPGVYWPGSAYVDWVGTDFYAGYPNFTLLDEFYSSFPGKPFVLSEWGLWGSDDPGFVHELFAWVRAHPRVRMLDYYQGFGSASWYENLARYPASRRALRHELSSRRYLAYAPEYAHPRRRRHRHRPPPQRPPQPPSPGVPPSPPPPPTCVPVLGVCVPGL